VHNTYHSLKRLKEKGKSTESSRCHVCAFEVVVLPWPSSRATVDWIWASMAASWAHATHLILPLLMGHCHRRFSRLRLFSMERRYRHRPPLPRPTHRSLMRVDRDTPCRSPFLVSPAFFLAGADAANAASWLARHSGETHPASRWPAPPLATTYSAQPRPSAASQRPAPALPPRVSPSREVETPRRPVRVHCTSADDGGRADPLTSVD
jgi:hypothetical protein